MAWLTRLSASELAANASEPDLETFAYWLERLGPVVEKGRRREEGEGETVIVLANRSGSEPGDAGAEEARYAGSSTVLGIRDGRVRVFGILGRAEEGVLVVDTSEDARMEVRTS